MSDVDRNETKRQVASSIHCTSSRVRTTVCVRATRTSAVATASNSSASTASSSALPGSREGRTDAKPFEQCRERQERDADLRLGRAREPDDVAAEATEEGPQQCRLAHPGRALDAEDGWCAFHRSIECLMERTQG